MKEERNGINRYFIKLTYDFEKEYKETAIDVGLVILNGRIVSKKIIEKMIEKKLTPIIHRYFEDSIAASNKIVKAGVSKLTDQLNVPFKYTKKLLDSINETSAFNGYYEGKNIFTKREITNIKKAILTSKYSDFTDKEMIEIVKNAVNVTKNRALVIARTETTRLNTTAKQIYYKKKAVKDKYKLVFHSQPDARPIHLSYNGKVADDEGYFEGECGKIKGPPVPCSPFNCRCRIEFEARS